MGELEHPLQLNYNVQLLLLSICHFRLFHMPCQFAHHFHWLRNEYIYFYAYSFCCCYSLNVGSFILCSFELTAVPIFLSLSEKRCDRLKRNNIVGRNFINSSDCIFFRVSVILSRGYLLSKSKMRDKYYK